ncbi:AAA family ATPase [Sorangium sp. So ce394]|uniref:AAA family ATPase n=1 Tax=Sorangium sp. So ce394 TaxID=3133310 RepID=UPI003F5B0962
MAAAARVASAVVVTKMTDPKLDPSTFGASFQAFLEQMAAQAPAQEPEIRRRIREHLGGDPAQMPVVSEQFAKYEHPNLHLALQAYLGQPEREAELFGITSTHEMFTARLSQIAAPRSAMPGAGIDVGPVEYVNLPLDQGRVIACVRSGVHLVRRGEQRLVVYVSASAGWRESLTLEVMAAERAEAEAVLAEVRNTMRARSIYRGHVISLEQPQQGTIDVRFHRLPTIGKDEIILPQGLLERIERHAVRFAELRGELRAMGRHLKRGMLLHGPPGTGKTLTAMYLAGQMPDRTVILLTGRGMGLIEQSCALARLLEPATVILEDVDLVAEERTRQCAGSNAVLFELLNQMDGLSDDADILFILTTNRPDILEPALAARPGRIDQALEVPLPDEGCRRRLFELYGRGLELRLSQLDALVARTKGVSAAFLRELLRKAALFAADEGAGRVVEDRHIDTALRELAVEGGKLTQSLLGASAISE